jgi:anti-sigma regulatory factor (Ser/Thr protein kinase)
MSTLKEYKELGADAGAPASARDLVTGALGGRDAETVQTVSLVVSELVSNAVLHGSRQGDSVGIELSVEPGRIRIEVVDFGEGFDPSQPITDTSGGYGLHIVESLSREWGVDRGPPHKVWCELPMR